MTFLFSGLRVDTDVLCAAADQLKSLCEFQGDDTFYCLTPQRWLEILTFAQSVSRGSASHHLHPVQIHVLVSLVSPPIASSKQWPCSWSLDTRPYSLL